jgi:hypothetical protein
MARCGHCVDDADFARMTEDVRSSGLSRRRLGWVEPRTAAAVGRLLLVLKDELSVTTGWQVHSCLVVLPGQAPQASLASSPLLWYVFHTVVPGVLGRFSVDLLTPTE